MSSAQMTRQKANNVLGKTMGIIDRIIPPETRRELINNCYNLANDRPLIATFLAIQIILSAVPFLLFVSFALATILLAVVVALAFCIFWIVAALLILIPTLFAALFAGIFIWIWVVGTYLFGRFAYRKVYPRLQQSAASRRKERKSLQDASGSRNDLSSVTKTTKAATAAANGIMSGGSASSSNANATIPAPAPGVPETVKRSFDEANESPEAAANEEAVEDKKAVESELLEDRSSGKKDYSRSNGKMNDTTADQMGVVDGGDYSRLDGFQQQSPRRFMPGEPKFT